MILENWTVLKRLQIAQVPGVTNGKLFALINLIKMSEHDTVEQFALRNGLVILELFFHSVFNVVFALYLL